MRLHDIVLSLTCVFLAATIPHSDANAGGVYKIIGPDGKVSFSDKPPADAATSDKIDVIRTQTAPLSSLSANGGSIAPASIDNAPSQIAAKHAPVVDSSQDSYATAKEPDPVVEKAIVGVLSYEDLVRQTESLCVRTLPTSQPKYSGAAEAWRSRNGALVAQAHQTLADQFNSPQHQAIESGIRAKNNAALMSVTGASTASKITWCDSSSEAIKDGTLDVYNKMNFSAPLVKARS